MPVAARHHRVSLDEYFAVERSAPGRHEFLDGQIYVMAGGPPRHDWLERAVDVEHWFRTEAGWERRVYTAPGDVVVLSGLGIEVPVAELYHGLDRLAE